MPLAPRGLHMLKREQKPKLEVSPRKVGWLVPQLMKKGLGSWEHVSVIGWKMGQT